MHLQLLQPHRAELTLPHQPVQKARRAGSVPMRLELSFFEQQQHVEGIVHLLLTEFMPAVAIVPFPYGLSFQSRQLRCEHRVKIRIRIATDGGILRIQTDVVQIVQSRKQTHLRIHADAGHEHETDVSGAALDDAVQTAQVVAVGLRLVLPLQQVQDRLVVFVHQNHHLPTGGAMQLTDDMAQPHRTGSCRRRRFKTRIFLYGG